MWRNLTEYTNQNYFRKGGFLFSALNEFVYFDDNFAVTGILIHEKLLQRLTIMEITVIPKKGTKNSSLSLPGRLLSFVHLSTVHLFIFRTTDGKRTFFSNSHHRKFPQTATYYIIDAEEDNRHIFLFTKDVCIKHMYFR